MHSKETIQNILEKEDLWQSDLEKLIEDGRVVVVANPKHKKVKPVAIGKRCLTKVNANIGTSPLDSDLKNELKKLEVAIEFGADTVMDLSTGKDLDRKRKEILDFSSIPIGSVPIYQIMEEIEDDKDFSIGMFLDVLEKHCSDGIDFVTIHSGLTKKALEHGKKQPRLMGVVSRGGAFIAEWIRKTGKENPLYVGYDKILKVLKKYKVAISLGDGLRPGSIVDATDSMQLEELHELGHMVRQARKAGVPAMVEGPGHVPINQIEENIKLQKRLCDEAPFYVLGPLVTDTAPGYDHITAAIGGALAGMYGADYLCYVTPAEHLTLPSLDDVKEGVIAMKIAAHAADIAKGISSSIAKDRKISEARSKFDWKTQISMSPNPKKSLEYYNRVKKDKDEKHMCGMCGRHCSIRRNN